MMVERFEKLSGTAGNLTKGSADTRAESLSDEVVEKLISNLQEVVHDFRQNLDGLTRLAKGLEKKTSNVIDAVFDAKAPILSIPTKTLDNVDDLIRQIKDLRGKTWQQFQNRLPGDQDLDDITKQLAPYRKGY